MKILKIIHGYPPIYNAGSEVYSQLLCHSLHQIGHQVMVFTREEDLFLPDYHCRTATDHIYSDIKLYMVNIPTERHRYRYHHYAVNHACEKLIENFKPDVVHIGHLNHLSLTLIHAIAAKEIPIVYTLHDFWLMCPRGQFIQRNSSSSKDSGALCDGQKNNKCARNCYAGYFSGQSSELAEDEYYWTNWVKRRMVTVHSVIEKVDLFIAPSRRLMNRYCDEFNLPEKKIIYMDYGFNHNVLNGRNRKKETEFVFGYIGTHIPTKGIDLLIKAFSELNHNRTKLKIWGRHRGQNTESLKRLVSTLDSSIQARIEWLPEYQNNNIVDEVFNQVDAIVVPSIWQENSPLVIHEALQARVGVITANFGGMGEYVKHQENGWLFQHRNYHSLTKVMQDVLLLEQKQFHKICQRGYLPNITGDVINIDDQASAFEMIYQNLINEKINGKC